MATTNPAKGLGKQSELVPTAHVKFTGMSASALGTPAELDDVQEFVVTARCRGVGEVLRKDGEVRAVRTMEVEHVEFGQIKEKPEDPQLRLADDPDDE